MLRSLALRPIATLSRLKGADVTKLSRIGPFSTLEAFSAHGHVQGVQGPPDTQHIVRSQVKLDVSRRHIVTGARLDKKSGGPTEVNEDWEPMAKGDKVLRLRLSTVRLDGVLKAGLQISKNKITKAFYEDRIRINGERPRKKSQQLTEGDEVDIIRGPNKLNPEFLDVSRVEVVTLNEDGIGHNDKEDEYSSDEEESSESKIPAVLKRYKSLTIENYAEGWKGPVEES